MELVIALGNRPKWPRSSKSSAICVLSAAILFLASCGVVTSLARLDNSLRSAGYSSVTTTISSGNSGAADLTIAARSQQTSSGSPIQISNIAWDSFPYRLGTVTIRLDNRAPTAFSHSDMQGMFGSRPAGYDKQTFAQASVSTGTLAISGIFALMMVALMVALVLSRATRSRGFRRSASLATDTLGLGLRFRTTSPAAQPYSKPPGSEEVLQLPPNTWPVPQSGPHPDPQSEPQPPGGNSI